MAILVLNCGSSSVKYQLFRSQLKDVLAQGIVAAIGNANASITHEQIDKPKIHTRLEVTDHIKAINIILDKLTDSHDGILKNKSEIQVVGHRVVHGGNRFSGSVIINEETKQSIQACFQLAPLHNPHNMEGIQACEKLLPGVLQVAVFDTAFHQTMPDYAYTYGIPQSTAKKYHIRKYGFHGTSHKYVSEKAAELLNRSCDQVKIITCHLGNGCSISAVHHGKSVDTSMGFTPLEGLLMGTRSGDIDPAIILFLMHTEHMSSEQIDRMLNDKSGLLGISGISNDMSILLEKSEAGVQEAALAIKVFCYRIKKYIAAYMGVLNSADAIVFTAGIGENAPYIRSQCCSGLEALGIVLDKEKNLTISSAPRCISSDISKVCVYVIPTREELVIAREAKRLLDTIMFNKL